METLVILFISLSLPTYLFGRILYDVTLHRKSSVFLIGFFHALIVLFLEQVLPMNISTWVGEIFILNAFSAFLTLQFVHKIGHQISFNSAAASIWFYILSIGFSSILTSIFL